MNDVTEMPGVAVPPDDVLVALVALAELVLLLLLFELPHPAATAATSIHNCALLSLGAKSRH